MKHKKRNFRVTFQPNKLVDESHSEYEPNIRKKNIYILLRMMSMRTIVEIGLNFKKINSSSLMK